MIVNNLHSVSDTLWSKMIYKNQRSYSSKIHIRLIGYLTFFFLCSIAFRSNGQIDAQSELTKSNGYNYFIAKPNSKIVIKSYSPYKKSVIRYSQSGIISSQISISKSESKTLEEHFTPLFYKSNTTLAESSQNCTWYNNLYDLWSNNSFIQALDSGQLQTRSLDSLKEEGVLVERYSNGNFSKSQFYSQLYAKIEKRYCNNSKSFVMDDCTDIQKTKTSKGSSLEGLDWLNEMQNKINDPGFIENSTVLFLISTKYLTESDSALTELHVININTTRKNTGIEYYVGSKTMIIGQHLKSEHPINQVLSKNFYIKTPKYFKYEFLHLESENCVIGKISSQKSTLADFLNSGNKIGVRIPEYKAVKSELFDIVETQFLQPSICGQDKKHFIVKNRKLFLCDKEKENKISIGGWHFYKQKELLMISTYSNITDE